ncbi:hypothetical protein TNCV_1091981 [Trichonephila clavipes]|nr:hypothetical protein TNCV_1091981 [Trichonephila clavipes]
MGWRLASRAVCPVLPLKAPKSNLRFNRDGSQTGIFYLLVCLANILLCYKWRRMERADTKRCVTDCICSAMIRDVAALSISAMRTVRLRFRVVIQRVVLGSNLGQGNPRSDTYTTRLPQALQQPHGADRTSELVETLCGITESELRIIWHIINIGPFSKRSLVVNDGT